MQAMDIDSLKNIVWLAENEGQVSIGSIGPCSCVAVATDEHNQLAALVKRPNESLGELLLRLDEALEKAWEEEVFTDEINA